MTLDPTAASPLVPRPDRLAAALSPHTRAIVSHSPVQSHGLDGDERGPAGRPRSRAADGLWIIADEIYGPLRLWCGAGALLHDVMEGHRIIFVQTLSKNWGDDGWRVAGWRRRRARPGDRESWCNIRPPALPVPVNVRPRGHRARAKDWSPIRVPRAGEPGSSVRQPGADRPRPLRQAGRALSICFFTIDGEPDTRRLAIRLVDETGVGLAPGGIFRRPAANPICGSVFARKTEDIARPHAA